MPISADRFEAIDDDGPRPGTNAAAILSFLRRNADRAFTQSEIAEATGTTSEWLIGGASAEKGPAVRSILPGRRTVLP